MSAQAAEKFEFPVKIRVKPETASHYLDQFAGFGFNKIAAEWLKDLQRSALTSLEERGLPQPKLERWKYTNLASAVRKIEPVLQKPALRIEGGQSYASSLLDWLEDAPEWLRDMLGRSAPDAGKYGDMMLWDLNTAFLQEGVVIDVPDDVHVAEPVMIHHTGSHNALTCPRLIVRLGRNASLVLQESYSGSGAYWTNAVTQIDLAEGARLQHYRIQDEDKAAVHATTGHIRLGTGAWYEGLCMVQGSKLSRNQMHATMQGEEASCKLYTLNLLSGDQLGDSTYEVEHVAENGYSDQNVKSVMLDKAHGVFQGKVHVHRSGQKTDGYQLSNALILSDTAQMDTKPELEIYADDVKCSHGATTGQLDEEALFYLRSRGVPEGEARALVIQAFLAEALEEIENESIASDALERARTWLAGENATGIDA